MGMWDLISGTTDSLKRNASNLTAWYPNTYSLNRIAPAAKNVCSSAYGYGSAAATKIDGAVRSNVNYYVPEQQRSTIYQFGTIVAQNVAHEGSKLIPGGNAVCNIVGKSVSDFNNKPNIQEVDVKALRDDIQRLERELREFKESNKACADLKPPCTTGIHSVDSQEPEDLKPANTSNFHFVANQKPEDVIRVFMMKEFMGRQFCDDLMVPVAPMKMMKEFMGRQFCDDLMVPVAPMKKATSGTRVDKMEE